MGPSGTIHCCGAAVNRSVTLGMLCSWNIPRAMIDFDISWLRWWNVCFMGDNVVHLGRELAKSWQLIGLHYIHMWLKLIGPHGMVGVTRNNLPVMDVSGQLLDACVPVCIHFFMFAAGSLVGNI